MSLNIEQLAAETAERCEHAVSNFAYHSATIKQEILYALQQAEDHYMSHEWYVKFMQSQRKLSVAVEALEHHAKQYNGEVADETLAAIRGGKEGV